MATKKKGARMDRKEITIVVALPLDLHTQVKTQASAQRKTLKGFVLEALQEHVAKGGKEK
jgi:hypothetical protein